MPPEWRIEVSAPSRVVSIVRRNALSTTIKVVPTPLLLRGIKVHVSRPDGVHAHDQLCAEVEHGKQNNGKILGHKRRNGPGSPEEGLPSTKLGKRKVSSGVGTSESKRQEGHARKEQPHTHKHTTMPQMVAV